jgi:hypothetical protein
MLMFHLKYQLRYKFLTLATPHFQFHHTVGRDLFLRGGAIKRFAKHKIT